MQGRISSCCFTRCWHQICIVKICKSTAGLNNNVIKEQCNLSGPYTFLMAGFLLIMKWNIKCSPDVFSAFTNFGTGEFDVTRNLMKCERLLILPVICKGLRDEGLNPWGWILPLPSLPLMEKEGLSIQKDTGGSLSSSEDLFMTEEILGWNNTTRFLQPLLHYRRICLKLLGRSLCFYPFVESIKWNWSRGHTCRRGKAGVLWIGLGGGTSVRDNISPPFKSFKSMDSYVHVFWNVGMF